MRPARRLRTDVTRRMAIVWPDPAPFRDRGGAPIRLLAVSDQLDPTLGDRRNREAIGPIDLIVGCGYTDLRVKSASR